MENTILSGMITAVIAMVIILCWFGRKEVILHPIRTFAVMFVAITDAYVMWMGYRLTNILASPDWCGKALQAERISSQSFGGLTACIDLMKIQLKALAQNSLIYAGALAFCLLVLIVIVVAQAKLSAGYKDGHMDLVPGDEPLPVRVEQPKNQPIPVTPTKVPPPAPPPE